MFPTYALFLIKTGAITAIVLFIAGTLLSTQSEHESQKLGTRLLMVSAIIGIAIATIAMIWLSTTPQAAQNTGRFSLSQ